MKARQNSWWKSLVKLTAVILTLGVVSSCNVDKTPTTLAIGKTYDECQTLYGPGTLVSFDAPHVRWVSYTSKGGEQTDVIFYDAVAHMVAYKYAASKIEDERLNYYLQLNAQGHAWKLEHASTAKTLQATWKRDDDATARYDGSLPALKVSLPGAPDV